MVSWIHQHWVLDTFTFVEAEFGFRDLAGGLSTLFILLWRASITFSLEISYKQNKETTNY